MIRKMMFVAAIALVVAFGVGFTVAGPAAAGSPVGSAVSAGSGQTPTALVSNTPKPKPSKTETGMCDVLYQLPAYTYKYQGATIGNPSGKAELKDLTADGVKGKDRQTACKYMVTAYSKHN